MDIRRPSWKDPKAEKTWRGSLDRHAMPAIGKMPVDAIAMRDVEAILTPIRQEKCQTARNVKQRIHAVMQWAIACGHRTDNPVDAEVKAHRKALPYADVPQAWPANNPQLQRGNRRGMSIVSTVGIRNRSAEREREPPLPVGVERTGTGARLAPPVGTGASLERNGNPAHREAERRRQLASNDGDGRG